MSEQTSSRRFALIIASDQYDDSRLNRLKAPANDADDLARVLRDPTIGGFEDITTVINQKADTVRDAIVKFFKGKKRNDLVLVYFSGHGIRGIDKGRLYLAAKDTDIDTPRSRGIEAHFITDEMDSSRIRRIVLVLDCCYSGAFALGAKSSPIGTSIDVGASFRGKSNDEGSGGYGRVVLTASSAVQVAWEGDKIHGDIAGRSLFTHYLVKGLETGAAGGTSPWITVDALYTYVYEHVIKAAEASGVKSQTPHKWAYALAGDIHIARNPGFVDHLLPPLGHHFISYSVLDGDAAASKLYDALQDESSPLPVWLDRRDVQQPGLVWDVQVENAIQGCKSILLIVTPDSVSPGCDCEREWRHALRYKKPIVLIRFDHVTDLPLYLATAVA